MWIAHRCATACAQESDGDTRCGIIFIHIPSRNLLRLSNAPTSHTFMCTRCVRRVPAPAYTTKLLNIHSARRVLPMHSRTAERIVTVTSSSRVAHPTHTVNADCVPQTYRHCAHACTHKHTQAWRMSLPQCLSLCVRGFAGDVGLTGACARPPAFGPTRMKSFRCRFIYTRIYM